MNITLKQLNVFITISQEKTLSAAADKLFLSKPAVSMALAELEKQLGHQLFERKNNRLIMNEMGRALLPLADEQIQRSKTISYLFDEQQYQGNLKIGASNTIGNHLLPALIAGFRSQTGQTHQQIQIDNSSCIADKIKEYELDIALVEAQLIDKELHIEHWFKDQMIVVASPQHPLASQQLVSIHELEQQPWIMREQGSGTREFFMNHIGQHLSQPNILFELSTTEAIINSCAVNLGLSCMSKIAAKHALLDKRLVALNININMARDLFLVWHKDKYQSPTFKSFVDYCQDWSNKES